MPSSAWTGTANSISLVPVTTSIPGGSSPENVNYLTNPDKIALMAQYTAMLATKTTLDETAAALSISSSAYDSACAGISTALISAGAPSNWATTWPDGTTSGPWPNIQGILANLWAQIASQQTALQAAISAAQAAAAQQAAVAASVAAALALQPGQSTVPNGTFGTGDSTGWVNQGGASVASYFGTLPGGAQGLTIPANGNTVSHSFPIIGGQTYQLNYQVFGASGNSGVTLRIYYGDIAVPVLSDGIAGSETGYTDLAGVTLPTSMSSTPPQFQWTAPAGALYASVAVFNTGSVPIYLQGITAIPMVMAGNITAGAITTGAIAVGAVSAAQISSLTAAQLTGQITSTQISNGAVSTPQLAAGSVTAGQLAASAVTANAIAANAVTAGAIAANSISATQIAAGAVTAGALAADSVTAGALAAGSVTTAALTANCVTAGNIAAGAITADMITSGTLNAALVSVTNLNASNITTGTLDASQVVFSDGTSINTASRVTTYVRVLANVVTIPSNLAAVITGLSWSVPSSATTDTFNITLALECYSPGSSPTNRGSVLLVIDGNTGSPVGVRSLPPGSAWLPVLFSVTGLSAGTHTFDIYAANSEGANFYADCYGILQRIY